MFTFLKELQLPSKLKLHELQELISTHFLYEEERGKLYLKSELNYSISIADFKIVLSKVDCSVADLHFKPALESSEIEKVRWIDIVKLKLPPWDQEPRIELLANHFILEDDSQRPLFNRLFRFWLIKAAQMVDKPLDETAVNRLVFCLQSDKQGIGKSTFGRILASPFNESNTPSIYEMTRPDFGKDAMIQMATNMIVMLDDINNWQSRGLKGIKSIISSKHIKVRPPYGTHSISKPRTASFFATTNEAGFLNEENDTRWAIFKVRDIDKRYNQIDMNKIWSEAFYLSNDNSELIFSDEMKEHCVRLTNRYQLKTELDEIVCQWFEICDNGSTAYDLYEQLPLDFKRLLGNGSGAISKLGKSLSRVFNKSNSYESGGMRKWKIRLRSDRQ